jgi:hypothetical protein
MFELQVPTVDLLSFKAAIGDICKGKEIIIVQEEADSSV